MRLCCEPILYLVRYTQFSNMDNIKNRKRKRTNNCFGFTCIHNPNFTWFEGAACSVYDATVNGYVLAKIQNVDQVGTTKCLIKLKASNGYRTIEHHINDVQTAFLKDDRVFVNLQLQVDKNTTTWTQFVGTIRQQVKTSVWTVKFDDDGKTLPCEGKHITHENPNFVRSTTAKVNLTPLKINYNIPSQDQKIRKINANADNKEKITNLVDELRADGFNIDGSQWSISRTSSKNPACYKYVDPRGQEYRSRLEIFRACTAGTLNFALIDTDPKAAALPLNISTSPQKAGIAMGTVRIEMDATKPMGIKVGTKKISTTDGEKQVLFISSVSADSQCNHLNNYAVTHVDDIPMFDDERSFAGKDFVARVKMLSSSTRKSFPVTFARQSWLLHHWASLKEQKRKQEEKRIQDNLKIKQKKDAAAAAKVANVPKAKVSSTSSSSSSSTTFIGTGKWSDTEISNLILGKKKYLRSSRNGGEDVIDWTAVAKFVGSRSEKACKMYNHNHIKSKTTKPSAKLVKVKDKRLKGWYYNYKLDQEGQQYKSYKAPDKTVYQNLQDAVKHAIEYRSNRYRLTPKEKKQGWHLSPMDQRIRIARRTSDSNLSEVMFGTIVGTLLNHDGSMFMNLQDDEELEGLDYEELEEAKELYKIKVPVRSLKQIYDVGQKIDSRYRSNKGKFYPGKIFSYDALKNKYKISYDDGETDVNVSHQRLRLRIK